MKCKYCGDKIVIIDVILAMENICYYCGEAKKEVEYDNRKKEESEEDKKIGERKHFFQKGINNET